jgi:hypothetical protein
MTTRHRIIPAAAVALALIVGAAPAAARPSYLGASQSASVRAGTQPSGPASNHSTPPATVVRITPASGGFDWADAGIGAAGGLALSILGIGTALVLTDRHARHPHRPAAPTS